MRLLVLGVDDHGQSCVATDTQVDATPIEGLPGVGSATLFRTSESPPPPCPPGLGMLVDNGLAPGLVHWYVVEHGAAPPDEHTAGTELHHHNAIDLVVVLDGSADVLVADGPHPVSAGDCIVMTGIDHGLRPGRDGCRLMSFAIGAATPRA